MTEKTEDKIAELIFKNGRFWTANPACPNVEAVAVQKGRILKVGSLDQVKDLAGKSTRWIDLEGAFVVPGFIDSHTHFLKGGLSLSSLNLRNARSQKEFVEMIKKEAEKTENGRWITNGEWDNHQFDSEQLPKKEWIDGVTPENPVCIYRKDMHMVFTNSLALKIAGLNKDSSNPEGGEIVRSSVSGEPTGLLTDGAIDLILPHIPKPDHKEKLKAAERAIELAHEKGVTSVHEMGPLDNLTIYEELYRKNKLNLRITVYPPLSIIDDWPDTKINIKTNKEFYKMGGLKGFVDGSLGSSTALFFESYSDDVHKKGIVAPDMLPPGKMEKRIKKADEFGFQVAVHAIGDKANHMILDIFEDVMKSSQKRDRRWRIEHAQHLSPEDIIRFGQLGVIASVQPYHLVDDGQWAEKRIGSSRIRYSYPYRSLLENNVRLALGSDWTVAPLNPISGIFSAVTRRTLDGKNPDGWVPEEKIPVEEAVKGYTVNASFAEFSEKIKGSIQRGRLADMVVLDKNIFNIDPVDIQNIQILMTIVNGRIVYRG